MEIGGKDGCKTLLKQGLKTEFGRGLGFDYNDRTISRCHVSFELHTSNQEDEILLHFDVTGKNPIWVYNRKSDEIRVYRRSERGDMEGGDMFCVSAKNPVWFTLKKVEFEGKDDNGVKRQSGFENELADALDNSCGLRNVEDFELESLDTSYIDPVKEFGFVVTGHEFDCYPKKMMHDIKNWNWFLEEERGEDSEDEMVREEQGKTGGRRKRKKGEDNDDDDDWTGESEDDEQITMLKKIHRPKYLTRSKDHNKSIKDTRNSKKLRTKKMTQTNEDETLGGFIVYDDDMEQERGSDEDDQEEEFDEEEIDD